MTQLPRETKEWGGTYKQIKNHKWTHKAQT